MDMRTSRTPTSSTLHENWQTELGPAGVTVGLVNERLKAPKGSFY